MMVKYYSIFIDDIQRGVPVEVHQMGVVPHSLQSVKMSTVLITDIIHDHNHRPNHDEDDGCLARKGRRTLVIMSN